MLRRLALLIALAAPGAAPGAVVAQDSDPDWPCVQRKVAHLTPGQMWAGPPIDASLGDWREDAEVARLARTIAVRRTGMEAAEAMIERFAEDLEGGARDRRLALVFAGAFELIEGERAEIVAGVGRYARKQQGLAERIDAMRAELREARAVAEPSNDALDRIEELEDAVAWDTRIYDERRESLSYVCETPVILERRIFALARAIMGHLD